MGVEGQKTKSRRTERLAEEQVNLLSSTGRVLIRVGLFPGQTVDQIADTLGLSDAQARKSLLALENHGAVEVNRQFGIAKNTYDLVREALLPVYRLGSCRVGILVDSFKLEETQ